MDPARLTDAITSAAHSLAVDQVTAEVTAALRAGGIEPVLLKGPTFARWLYPSDGLRPYVDTDLLVAPGDQDHAAGVLQSLGFDDPMAAALSHERDDHSRTFSRDQGDGAAEVDLHFTLAGARAEPGVVWAVLTRELHDIDVAGTPVKELGTAARTLQVALHAAQDGRVTDQPLEDLARALTTCGVDTWHAAAALAREIDALSAFAAGLSRDAAGARLLADLGIDAGESGTYERLRGGTPPPMSLGIARLLERRDRRGLARELLREVVPTPAFMRVWSPVARRGRLGLAVAYLWRPVSLLIRVGPAVRAYLRARRATGRPRSG